MTSDILPECIFASCLKCSLDDGALIGYSIEWRTVSWSREVHKGPAGILALGSWGWTRRKSV